MAQKSPIRLRNIEVKKFRNKMSLRCRVIVLLLLVLSCKNSSNYNNLIIDIYDYDLDDCLSLSQDSLIKDCYLIMSDLELNDFTSKFTLRRGCSEYKKSEIDFQEVSLLALPTITNGHEVDYERSVVFDTTERKWFYNVDAIVTEKTSSIHSNILNFNLVLVPKLKLNDTVIFISNDNYIGLQIAK